MFKAQKGSKDIIKIVHVVHQWFNLNLMKLREYFLCANKTEHYLNVRLYKLTNPKKVNK